MIERMSGLDGGVIGLTAVGKVTGEDYEQVVVPAVEAALKEHARLRLLYHLGPEFEGFETAALWNDARVGLRHWTAWERTAVVTDHAWVQTATKALGFVLPGEVRVFPDEELDVAKAWVCRSSPSHIEFEYLSDPRIVVLTPTGPLQAADFERVAAEIDPLIGDIGSLDGFLIRGSGFAGWSSFAGLIAHLRFVRGHHERVGRVAVVTDGAILSHLPAIARHFVQADVRHFPSEQEQAAMAWLSGTD